jgi:hypothetical protein
MKPHETPLTKTYHKVREILEKHSPGRIRFQSLFMASLHLPLVLGVFGGGMASLLAGKVVPGIVLLVWSGPFLFRALRANTPEMLGRVLTQKEAPLLFEEVSRICRQLGCRRTPARFEISEDVNAAVFLSKPGIFGGTPVLRVGLPLMLSMTPDEFRGVLAHECGHLKAQDDFWGRLLHRLTSAWLAGVHGDADNSHNNNFLWRRFGRWFWPRLRAWTLADGRCAERKADAVCDQLFPSTVPSRLRVTVLAQALLGRDADRWCGRLIDERSEPPEDFFQLRALHAMESWDPKKAGAWIHEALHRPDNLFEVHPPLSELQFGAAEVELATSAPPPEIHTSAAAHFLGDHFTGLSKEFGLRTKVAWNDGWKKRREDRKMSLLQITTQDDGTLESAQLRAIALLNLDREPEALPLMDRCRAGKPKEADLHARYAALCCECDIPGAEEIVESVVRSFPHLQGGILNSLIGYQSRGGNREASQKTLVRLIAFEDELEAAKLERNALRKEDVLLPHELTEDQIAWTSAFLESHGDIVEARVGQKSLRHLVGAPPLHVLIVRFGGAARGSSKIRAARQQEIANALSQNLGELFVGSEQDFSTLWKRLSSQPASLLVDKIRGRG